MQFSQYLKSCRSKQSLTQEELVHALYGFNIDYFRGLDTTTLSKWERGITQPKIDKQISIIKFFQTLTHLPLPCFDNQSTKVVEEYICKIGMSNIMQKSKSKKLILDFPSATMNIHKLSVHQAKDTNMLDKVSNINSYLDKNFNYDLTQLEAEDFRKWALIEGNLFLTCEYEGELIGLLFVLKLKPKSFQKIINAEIMERELCNDDFALPHEDGSSYILSFFALNQKAASLLFVHYYAYLIAHQNFIRDVGVATMIEDGQKLIESISIPYYKSCIMKNEIELQFFKAPLGDFLTTPKVIRMILSKQECKEE